MDVCRIEPKSTPSALIHIPHYDSRRRHVKKQRNYRKEV